MPPFNGTDYSLRRSSLQPLAMVGPPTAGCGDTTISAIGALTRSTVEGRSRLCVPRGLKTYLEPDLKLLTNLFGEAR